jgi:tetratricopeptide (TPR) repeat protein
MSEYNRATALYPTWSAPTHNMGVVLFMRGELDPAMERFDAALRLDPKDATALTGRARILVLQKRLDEAIQEYQDAISHNAGTAAYRELAALLRSQRKTAQATALMETFEKYNIDPTVKRDDVRASKESAHCKD